MATTKRKSTVADKVSVDKTEQRNPGEQYEEETCPAKGQHSKEFFLSSHWYSHKRSLLEEMLVEERMYTVEEVESMLAS